MNNELNSNSNVRALNDDVYVIDLVEVMYTLWRRKLAILAFLFVFAACTVAYLVIAPRSYESRTTLLFLPSPQEQGVALDSDAYLTLATSDDLLDEVIKEVYAGEPEKDVPSVYDIRRNLDVKLVVPPNSRERQQTAEPRAMNAVFREKNPDKAMKVLNSWDRLFVEKSKQFAVDRNEEILKVIEQSVESAKKDLETAENALMAYDKDNPVQLMEIQLKATGEIYSGLMTRYNARTSALPPLEAKAKVAASLLAKEPETKTLSRGMSRDALWNFAAQASSGAAKIDADLLNVPDEIQNPVYVKLKEQSADAEINIESHRVEIADLNERLEQTHQEYEELNARIVAVKTERARLARESKTFQDSYVSLSARYETLRAATIDVAAPLMVIENPITPSEPAPRGGLKILGLASLLGLFVGTVYVLIAEMFAKRNAAA